MTNRVSARTKPFHQHNKSVTFVTTFKQKYKQNRNIIHKYLPVLSAGKDLIPILFSGCRFSSRYSNTLGSILSQSFFVFFQDHWTQHDWFFLLWFKNLQLLYQAQQQSSECGFPIHCQRMSGLVYYLGVSQIQQLLLLHCIRFLGIKSSNIVALYHL